ncbi:acetolactate synthase 3 catalytic subunit [Cupriavidus basilensis OR16]|uniref:Acetolactate synthase 3 catalytic subunit n=1 Tax=Cupriavidus basilensis OR16 TaxID=1127483 RepID=H1S8Q3_9BURK|nr:acetolactate synthase 3 catalytic subunit [Cupriavidus basilensis OR16]
MEALPDFPALARAYGHVGLRFETAADMEPAIREALSPKDRTAFMDFHADAMENVWPMVRSGHGLTDMLFGVSVD